MEKYVKADAAIEEKVSAPVVPLKVTAAQKTAILKLAEINELTVRKIIKSNKVDARAVIKGLVTEGKLKTYSQRYFELYPPKEEV